MSILKVSSRISQRAELMSRQCYGMTFATGLLQLPSLDIWILNSDQFRNNERWQDPTTASLWFSSPINVFSWLWDFNPRKSSTCGSIPPSSLNWRQTVYNAQDAEQYLFCLLLLTFFLFGVHPSPIMIIGVHPHHPWMWKMKVANGRRASLEILDTPEDRIMMK